MKIAIAGYGVEGKSNYEYFSRGDDQVVIVDEREVTDAPVDASVITGEGAFEKLQGFDMVVRTAGLAPRKIKTDGKVWSATNEFFAKCPAAIIGVTGSKGKGTTSSLIASILREAGQDVHLVGNIGVPALDILPRIQPTDIVVYELSSFQLWDLEKSPQVAVVLMIEPDHLDVHENFDEYLMAKANIRKFQKAEDICFYHPTNEFSRRIAEVNPFPNAHRYNDPSDSASISVDGNDFIESDGCVVAPVTALQLPGAHNVENACAAICAAYAGFGVGRDAIERGLRAFTGLDHRLKFVREVAGVKYYDDSIATTPGSAIAAMKAFDAPKTLILGGSSKGADFTEVAEVAKNTNVHHVVLIGQEADKIEQAFMGTEIAISNLGAHTTMQKIVETAQELTAPGGVVVLSPACASFGMFKNYKDRGDQFIASVNLLQ